MKKKYSAPSIKIEEVMIEKGFALSPLRIDRPSIKNWDVTTEMESDAYKGNNTWTDIEW